MSSICIFLFFIFSEGSNGEIIEEIVGPIPKPQVTLTKKDYGKVSMVQITS